MVSINDPDVFRCNNLNSYVKRILIKKTHGEVTACDFTLVKVEF